MQLTYGDHVRDFTKLPAATQAAIANSGYAHYLGNVVASKVVGNIRKHLAGADGKVESITKDQVRTFRESNGEVIAKWTAEGQAEVLDAMDKGELGIRAVGVRVDPLTAAMRAIARMQVVATLKANNLKTPKGDDTVSIGGQPFTMDALIERRLGNAKFAPGIKKEAERKIAEDARRAKAAVAAAEGLDL